MTKIKLKDVKSPSANVTVKETKEGYTLHISRSNKGLTAASAFVALIGFIFLVYSFNNYLLIIISGLTFWFSYWILKFTFGFLEIRFNKEFIQFIWDDEIKNGSKGTTLNILDIKSVQMKSEDISSMRRIYLDYRINAFVVIHFKNAKVKLFSCVDPEYHPFISIFIKKYINGYNKLLNNESDLLS
jgi:hypothetical protein